MALLNQLSKISDSRTRFIYYDVVEFSVSLVNRKISKIEESNRKKVKIDIIENSKRLSKLVSALDFNFVKKHLRKMKQFSSLKDLKFYDEFPETKEPNRDRILDLGIMDFSRDDLADLLPLLLDYNKDLLKTKEIKSVSTEFNFSIVKKNFVTNFEIYEDFDLDFSVSSYVSVKDKTESSHWVSKDFFTLDEFNLNKLKEELLNKVEFEKNPVFDPKINSKNYDLIFGPEILSSLINTFIIGKMNVEHYKKKDNYLYNLDSFDSKINIYEDPFVDYSFYSNIYDNDFILTSKKHFIENGKVKGFWADLDTAYKYNEKTTGNALPNVYTNLFMENGKKSFNDLISETKNGLIVLDLLGLHTTNSDEGKLNLTASAAIEIKDGRKARVLKNVPLNEDFSQLLKDVELSKELVRVHSKTLPYLFSRRF